MKIPETFDWVDARANCSAELMFTLLVARLAADVDAMRPRLGTSYQLAVSRVSDDKVIVAKRFVEFGLMYERRNRSVVCSRTDSGLAVHVNDQKGQEARALFVASASLGPEGRCRYEVDGQPLELWQVSRKALEDLFFA